MSAWPAAGAFQATITMGREPERLTMTLPPLAALWRLDRVDLWAASGSA
mgnify:CR=1 FL=1